MKLLPGRLSRTSGPFQCPYCSPAGALPSYCPHERALGGGCSSPPQKGHWCALWAAEQGPQSLKSLEGVGGRGGPARSLQCPPPPLPHALLLPPASPTPGPAFPQWVCQCHGAHPGRLRGTGRVNINPPHSSDRVGHTGSPSRRHDPLAAPCPAQAILVPQPATNGEAETKWRSTAASGGIFVRGQKLMDARRAAPSEGFVPKPPPTFVFPFLPPPL